MSTTTARIRTTEGKHGKSYRVVWRCSCHRRQWFSPSTRNYGEAVDMRSAVNRNPELHADAADWDALVRGVTGEPEPEGEPASTIGDNTLGYWLARWIESRVNAPTPPIQKTVDGYWQCVDRLKPWLGIRLDEWSDGTDGRQATYAVVRNGLRAKHTHNVTEVTLDRVMAALALAQRYGGISYRPERPRRGGMESAGRALTYAECVLLLDAITCPSTHAYVSMMLGTGCRPKEAQAVTRGALFADVVNQDGTGRVDIIDTKVKRGGVRPVALDAGTFDYMTQVAAELPEDGRLFRFALDTYRDRVADAAKRAGIGHVKLHDFRHTVATRMAHEGWPAASAAQRLGITAARYSTVYVQRSDEADQALANAMAAGIAEARRKLHSIRVAR